MSALSMIEPKNVVQHSAQVFSIHSRHDVNTFDALMAMSARVAEEMASEMRIIQALHPEWYQMYEDSPAETSTAEQLMALLESAPNSFAKGLAAGALQVRLEIAAVTGRMF
jgi:hypothetical protein